MPDLSFQVMGVDAAVRSLSPLLHFKVRVSNSPPDERVQAVLLNAQIQIQAPQRGSSAGEKENLVELFGPPEVWGQSLRNRLWAQTSATVGSFSSSTEAILAVPCTFDLNVAASKYFYALGSGEVPLLFLFSGTVFYTGSGRLQVAPISWNQECVYRLPAQTWRELMDRHYPNTAWLSLRRDTFDRLYAHKRRYSLMTWEETIEHLLKTAERMRTAKNEPEREKVAA